MANRDDRDNRKKHTPPAGVKKQIASDPEFEWEDLTPPIGIDVNELQQINVRAKNASMGIKAAFRMISEVKQTLDIDRINREGLAADFSGLREKVSGLGEDVSRLETKVDDQGTRSDSKFEGVNEHIGKMRETTAGLAVAVGMMAEQMKVDRETRQKQELIEAEAEAQQDLIEAKAKADQKLIRATTESEQKVIEAHTDAEHKLILAKSKHTLKEYRAKDENLEKEHRRKWARRILWVVTSVASALVVHLIHTC